ncbi:hypothetical protein [Paraburkholderia ferrariae]|uniref:Phage integrase family protein n=1 Tax=Paraburkholderia ferrariae TaxID=386056 RepID=A0ABU9RVV8_9BURK
MITGRTRKLRRLWSKEKLARPERGVASFFCVRCAGAQRDLGEFDLDAGIWTIAGERMKAGEPHRVPMAVPVGAMLKTLKELVTRRWCFHRCAAWCCPI